ncbi:hypothetical protein BJ912DRAFT_856656 [Pholiota molesta]|nr:hypothetical protein BJ912DRAFT_856656 [Pholiota molesta]
MTTTSTASGAQITTSSVNVTVDPGLTFVLTETSLAVAATPSSTPATTLTDPDQATSTATPLPDNSAAAATATSVPLPSGIPGRILPSDQLDPTTDTTGYTLISILFDSSLNWPFVVNSPVSSSQIFAYVPVLIGTALGITGDQIKTFALQVYIPTSYRSAADQDNLGTTWLGYIPSGLVNTLAAQIKVKQSSFYTGNTGVAGDLAARVNSGYAITSVPASSVASGGDGSAGGAGTQAGGADRSRQDAIIGVVSALGAIALLVLVFLVFRSMRRRRELAHRRLSDPPMVGGGGPVEGARPDGREFDQDSVGAPRRRSFYFAEDSLRGYAAPVVVGGGEEDVWDAPRGDGQQVMSQRRNVLPSAISAPILRESSMNW